MDTKVAFTRTPMLCPQTRKEALKGALRIKNSAKALEELTAIKGAVEGSSDSVESATPVGADASATEVRVCHVTTACPLLFSPFI